MVAWEENVVLQSIALLGKQPVSRRAGPDSKSGNAHAPKPSARTSERGRTHDRSFVLVTVSFQLQAYKE